MRLAAHRRHRSRVDPINSANAAACCGGALPAHTVHAAKMLPSACCAGYDGSQ